MTQPISTSRLKQICAQACDSALSTVSAYSHSSTESWNNTIIQAILKALIAESSPSDSSSDKPSSRYKFAVNSTIIQHLSDPREGGEDGVSMGGEGEKKVGRRGMHSASGAYWNNEKDGMWSYKYEGGVDKGMDVVVSVMWIAV